MKELSIEEKAARYDEAIKKLEDIKTGKCQKTFIFTEGLFEYIFPELAESEDERIRKALVKHCKEQADIYKTLQTAKEYNEIQSWIAWLEKHKYTEEDLDKAYKCADEVQYRRGYEDAKKELEKQGEQKPCDTPKFHEGEWIVHQGTGNIYQIATVIDNQYQLKYNDTYTTTQRCVDVDIDARHWTLADAKEGDVLAFDDDTIVLFKDLYNKTSFHSYCHIEEGVFTASEEDVPDWWQGKGFEPATKEQRDTLMKAMADAGYTFDFEKKELKKIEQEYHCTGVREPKEATGVLKQLLNKENYAWSEEDEAYRVDILVKLEPHITDDNFTDVQNWFKSIKERYLWKPSEEQIEALEHFVRSIGESGYASPYDNNTKLVYSLLLDLKKLK